MEKPLSELEGEIMSVQGRPIRNDCLFFVCPVCPVCTDGHGIMISFEKPSIVDKGFVWTKVSGSSIADITINPSINCDVDNSGCKFHGWVKEGKVTW